MKIECSLKREGGTKVEIGGIDYHFKPREDGKHVAEVNDEEHIARFLSIPEGYAKAEGNTPAASDPVPPAAPVIPEAAAAEGNAPDPEQTEPAADPATTLAATEPAVAAEPAVELVAPAIEPAAAVAAEPVAPVLSRQQKAAMTRAANKAK